MSRFRRASEVPSDAVRMVIARTGQVEHFAANGYEHRIVRAEPGDNGPGTITESFWFRRPVTWRIEAHDVHPDGDYFEDRIG